MTPFDSLRGNGFRQYLPQLGMIGFRRISSFVDSGLDLRFERSRSELCGVVAGLLLELVKQASRLQRFLARTRMQVQLPSHS